MNVLSLFDGHRCGAMALQAEGVPITNYFASEVDPHAMLNCGVSDAQLYKMFGNDWTIEVIAHILRNLL